MPWDGNRWIPDSIRVWGGYEVPDDPYVPVITRRRGRGHFDFRPLFSVQTRENWLLQHRDALNQKWLALIQRRFALEHSLAELVRDVDADGESWPDGEVHLLEDLHQLLNPPVRTPRPISPEDTETPYERW